MKGVVHKVYCELYKTELTVCFHKETYEKKFGTTGDYSGCVSVVGGVINIFVEKSECGGISVITSSHEAYHASDFIFDRCGIEYKANSGNEHAAYLVGWVTLKIFDCLDNDNKWEGICQ